MAYSTGSTIIDDDYNLFATGTTTGSPNHTVANVNTVWGSGSTDAGYGQASTLSSVSAGTTITATQWSNMLARITSAANHQGSSITAISSPSVGTTISAYSALSTNINTIYGNRLNAAASGTDITSTVTTTTAWSTQATCDRTVTFSSGTAMRYFFNAGGMIRLSFSRSGGSSTNQNTGWSNLLTACGTLVFTGYGESITIAGTTYTGTTKIGGSGTPNVQLFNTGILDGVSGTFYTFFRQYVSEYLYTASYIQIDARYNSAGTLNFACDLYDVGNVGTGSDTVDGTLSSTITIRPPSTTYITGTWGTPSNSAASWVVT